MQVGIHYQLAAGEWWPYLRPKQGSKLPPTRHCEAKMRCSLWLLSSLLLFLGRLDLSPTTAFVAPACVSTTDATAEIAVTVSAAVDVAHMGFDKPLRCAIKHVWHCAAPNASL